MYFSKLSRKKQPFWPAPVRLHIAPWSGDLGQKCPSKTPFVSPASLASLVCRRGSHQRGWGSTAWPQASDSWGALAAGPSLAAQPKLYTYLPMFSARLHTQTGCQQLTATTQVVLMQQIQQQQRSQHNQKIDILSMQHVEAKFGSILAVSLL